MFAPPMNSLHSTRREGGRTSTSSCAYHGLRTHSKSWRGRQGCVGSRRVALVRRKVATGDDLLGCEKQGDRNRRLDVVEKKNSQVVLGERQRENKALLIRGGSQLEGEVEISGSKNAVLALLAASLLSRSSKVKLSNVPLELTDVKNMIKVLSSLGVQHVLDLESQCVELDCSSLTSVAPNADHVRALRASFLVTGPLLARLGEAWVALPGGCKIGSRPVDLHLKGLQALGAEVELGEEAVYVRLNRQSRKLKGAHIDFDYPSVGATETVLMASCFAEGETVISNAACEPEIEELAEFLEKMGNGIRIEGAGTGRIVIQGSGSDALRESSCSSSSSSSSNVLHHSVCPDRIEAGTYLVAGAITESPQLVLRNVHHPHIAGITKVLRDMGCFVEERQSNGNDDGHDDGGEVLQQDLVLAAPSRLRAIEMVRSKPWPGFPTDLLPILHPLLAVASGTSMTEETVFDNRMSHTLELKKFGCDIEIVEGKAQRALIRGRGRVAPGLQGACVTASDLRGGAALILAGLASKGETLVEGLHYVDRGYCSLEEKLRNIGADVERIKV